MPLNKWMKELQAELEKLNVAMEEAASSFSLLESTLCEANGGHDWKLVESNETFEHPHLECSICGTVSIKPNEKGKTS